MVEWRKTSSVPFYFTFEARDAIESRRVRPANSNLTTTCQHVAGPPIFHSLVAPLHDSAATTRPYTVRPLQGSSCAVLVPPRKRPPLFFALCRHFVAMSLDNEEEGDEGNEEEKEEEERSSGSDGGEAATTVKARWVAGTEPAAKTLKLRRSNRYQARQRGFNLAMLWKASTAHSAL